MALGAPGAAVGDEGRHLEAELSSSVELAWADALHAFVMPVHMIFDDGTRTAGPLAMTTRSWNGAVEGLTWSADNAREVEKGWITRASSIDELAAKIGRDASALGREIELYNSFCADGEDKRFGRPSKTLKPIQGPPYYAIEVVPCIVATTGGAKRDERAQVLDHCGNPIRRLYEAGELGSILSNLYQNGCFLTECMVFGRIAGKEAPLQIPWSNR